MKSITKEDVLTLLDYDPVKCEFVWKHRDISYFKSRRSYLSFCKRWVGKPATSIKKSNDSKTFYRQIKILGNLYNVSQVMFVLCHGYIPKMIDHIDGDGLNNNIDNLRDVDSFENQKNRSLPINSKLGIIGVRLRTNKRKMSWNVRIKSNGVAIEVGHYDDFFEACCARKSAERKLGFHLNHGRVFECSYEKTLGVGI